MGQRTSRRNSRSGKTSTTNEKGYEGRNKWTRSKKRRDLPAILRRCTSRSSVRAIGSSHGNVREKQVISSVRHRRNKVLKHAFLMGRCQTALSRSKRTTRGTVERTSFSNVCTILNSLAGQCGMSERPGAPRVLESLPRKLIGREASRGRKDAIGGTPHGYAFIPMEKSPRTSRRLVQGSGLIRQNRAERPYSCLALSS